MWCFCHTSTWISHRCTCVPHPEPPTHLPTHPIPLGCPRAPVLKVLRKLHSSGVASFLNSPALNLWRCPGTFQPRLAGPPARAESRMGAGGSLSPPPHVKQTEQCHPDCCYSPQGKNVLSRLRTQKNNERKIQTLIQIEAIYFQSPQTHFALIHGENLGKQSKPHIQKPDLFYCAQRPDWEAARDPGGQTQRFPRHKGCVSVGGCNQSPNSHPA